MNSLENVHYGQQCPRLTPWTLFAHNGHFLGVYLNPNLLLLVWTLQNQVQSNLYLGHNVFLERSLSYMDSVIASVALVLNNITTLLKLFYLDLWKGCNICYMCTLTLFVQQTRKICGSYRLVLWKVHHRYYSSQISLPVWKKHHRFSDKYVSCCIKNWLL